MDKDRFLNRAHIQENQALVKEYSELIDLLVERAIREYSQHLDEYMQKITELLSDKSYIISDLELEDAVLTLPQLIYWASDGLERLSIKEDISRSMRNEEVLKSLQETTGTVSQRNLQAEVDTLTEEYVQLIYGHATKQLKNKIGFAMEMLQSIKKILSKRMNESERDYIPETRRPPERNSKNNRADRF